MKVFRTILTVGIFLGGIWASRADVLERWYWRNPLPQGNALYNVVFANGTYVALGELGTILTSTDGTNWLTQQSGTTMELRDCAYGGGKYVVVGDHGTVLTSADASNWIPQYPGTFFSLNGITYADGQFVCVGEQTTILTSRDAMTWTARSSGPWELKDVIHAGGLYAAGGGIDGTVNSVQTRVLLTSTDGWSWTTRVLSYGQPFTSLAYGNGLFAASTGPDPWNGLSPLWSSSDGIDWQPATAPLTYVSGTTVCYGNGKWVLTYGNPNYYLVPGQVYSSDDLLNWSPVFTNATPILGICYGNEKFVAANAGGDFLLSSDSENWYDPLPDIGPAALNDLAFLNGQFVGLNYERFLWSSNGAAWTTTSAPTNTGTLFSLTYGKGRYVAGGELRMVWTSTNGLDWINPTTNLSSYPYSSDVQVAYGNGVFVGVAGPQGDILTSDDGDNWTIQSLITNANDYVYFRDITFANGQFVAVSETATATSLDGTNWFVMRTNLYLFAVTGGAGKFVAVGGNIIATSTDGTNWSTQTIPDTGPGTSLADVAFGAGWFIASTVNYSFNLPLLKQPSVFWISADGFHWSRRTSITPQGLVPIAFGDGTFVVGTKNGGILQSDPLIRLGLVSTPAPEIQIFGPHNKSYRIECLDGLGQPNSWWELATTPPTNNVTQFADTTWTNRMNRFYRAVLLP